MDRLWQFLLGMGGAVLFSQLFDIWHAFDYFLWLFNETIFSFQRAYPQYAEILPPIIAITVVCFCLFVAIVVK